MVKKLASVGNSLGLIIDRPILELLDIRRDTLLELKTDGECLIIRPLHQGRRSGIFAAPEPAPERAEVDALGAAMTGP